MVRFCKKCKRIIGDTDKFCGNCGRNTKDSINFSSDLLIILLWTIITFFFSIIPILSDNFIRTILGIPMVMFIPGYILIVALLPNIEIMQKIAIGFGLSIAVISILGLFLNFTFGLILFPMIVTLCIYVIVLIFVAAYRNGYADKDRDIDMSFSLKWNISDFFERKSQIVLNIILIFTIALSVGLGYYAIKVPDTGEKFTEYYILNSSGWADNYPTDLKLNSPIVLKIGIINHEYSYTNYTVKVALDQDVLASEYVSLNHEENWKKDITFIPNVEGVNKKLELLLYKENNFTVPYRTLYLWINVYG